MYNKFYIFDANNIKLIQYMNLINESNLSVNLVIIKMTNKKELGKDGFRKVILYNIFLKNILPFVILCACYFLIKRIK